MRISTDAATPNLLSGGALIRANTRAIANPGVISEKF
jgi:hypothetical protein